ncbi:MULTISPECIES: hypothetical protein [unclassified Enterococcus]|jgi:hypothetical protein|uniref:hypothetical protein n=1 Tax=Enterococcus TaxID=1350 RepID=UPI000A33BF62|nr:MULTISPECIES: hypothetical protein [unclassified Enterococcus]EAE0774258.1 hypothetical protein [Listeria monocytogenes]OTO15637.1 hypothetical protein A5878_000204 [Enterococcus sp. 3G6_DIV0642]OTO30809.1 hypothetical protein A5876_001420 [Enterococcus sp. 3C8_DIV0646]
MKTKSKLGRRMFATVCLAVLFFLASCSRSGVDSAAANQVLTNSNSHQQYALYLFEDGRITVNKTLSFLVDPNQEPADLVEEQEAQLVQINETLQAEFPKSKALTAADIGTMHTFEVTNAQVIIDQEKKEVRMTGDDFEKVFKMVDNNDKRLIDDEQNEYEFSYDEK